MGRKIDNRLRKSTLLRAPFLLWFTDIFQAQRGRLLHLLRLSLPLCGETMVSSWRLDHRRVMPAIGSLPCRTRQHTECLSLSRSAVQRSTRILAIAAESKCQSNLCLVTIVHDFQGSVWLDRWYRCNPQDRQTLFVRRKNCSQQLTVLLSGGGTSGK
jgi:hypothetical protein